MLQETVQHSARCFYSDEETADCCVVRLSFKHEAILGADGRGTQESRGVVCLMMVVRSWGWSVGCHLMASCRASRAVRFLQRGRSK
jgi:hypothetical protein